MKELEQKVIQRLKKRIVYKNNLQESDYFSRDDRELREAEETLELLEYYKEKITPPTLQRYLDMEIKLDNQQILIEELSKTPSIDEMLDILADRYPAAGILFHPLEKYKFTFSSYMIPICWLERDGTVHFATNDLTPDLVELIGKFYKNIK